ncbi:hypothetical protein KKC1_13750 [Calderihabitans maritimus]|uniref:Uncharacterized protein n=1 Tax=Calderihabitans maritimus TaxID=1246530 RepID=A0A1Z5HS75_9FIRM|nr:hypothetical protein KKC1_13750 [Calderihabitans maritimus]
MSIREDDLPDFFARFSGELNLGRRLKVTVKYNTRTMKEFPQK